MANILSGSGFLVFLDSIAFAQKWSREATGEGAGIKLWLTGCGEPAVIDFATQADRDRAFQKLLAVIEDREPE